MKKKLLSAVMALSLSVIFSAGMTANAYSWQFDLGIKSYDHNSEELDWSLWEDFLKYDLRITDFEALDSEKQELCKYIYETEMMSEETIVCERARRIVAGEDVGERLTLEKCQQYELIGDYKWIYSEGVYMKDNNYDTHYKYRDKFELFCVPDIKHMGNPNYNEYWLDDEGTEYIEYKGEATGYVADFFGSSFTYVDSDGNREYFDFARELEYKVIKYDGLYFKVYPDNTLSLTGTEYNGGYNMKDSINIPDVINDMTVTRIASGAFRNCPAEKIYLPSTVEYIEPLAFDNCLFLKNVDLPYHIKRIAPYAFYECHSLWNLTINCPDVDISASSFYNCNMNILSVKTKNVPYFSDYSEINQVDLMSGVEELDVNYFTDGTKIPESVRIISGHIYSSENDDITVPENIEILGAFDDISPIFMGSCIDSYPVVPLLEEEYSISADNISGYYNTEAHRYALAHNIKFTPLDDINYGDTNNDGEINIADAVILQKYLLGNGETGFEADINKDGYIDIFDMILMRKNLIK